MFGKTLRTVAKTSALAALLGAFTACLAEEPGQESDTLLLLDPCTGDEVGVKDAETGTYYFAEGMVVESKEIDTQYLQSPVDTCTVSQEVAKKHASLVCWSMVEGGAGCTGCCDCDSSNSCYCAESCWDVMKS